MPSYAHPEVLVDTQWVTDNLDDPNVRLYDGSWLEWGGLIGVPIERQAMSSRIEPENVTRTTISVETLRDSLDRSEPVTVRDIGRTEAR